MRGFRVILAACALFFATPPEAEAYDLALQACLGAPVAACLAAMRPFVHPIEFRSAMTRLDSFDEPDVAGQRPSRGKLSVTYHSAYAPDFAPAQIVMLDFGAARRTEAVEISLAPGSEYASTARDYARTRIFEAALFALGPRPDCPDMATPLDFYRFFQTRVRPRLSLARPAPTDALPKLPVHLGGDTGWIALCGRKIRYAVMDAQWGRIGRDMSRTYKTAVATLAFR